MREILLGLLLALIPVLSVADEIEFRLEKLGDGFRAPTFIVAHPTLPHHLLIVEQTGEVVGIKNGHRDEDAFLDIRDRVSAGGETGLLSLVFHPDFQKNSRIFVNYTARDPKLRTVIAEFNVATPGGKVDPASEKRLLTIDQPYANHNGGQLAFGPDGMLYIGMGDGGSAFDPENRAQNLKSLLGKMLRIDVDHGSPYKIPKDNPFAVNSGGLPEIWAWGLRNPWRFSFDRKSGELLAGDVGQNTMEEIDIVERGGNYGWKLIEGTNCLATAEICADPKFHPPLITYGRSEGISVTGGYVYRGNGVPALQGLYLYGDFGSGRIWALQSAGGKLVQHRELRKTNFSISTFGEDLEGELYLADYPRGEIYQIKAPSK